MPGEQHGTHSWALLILKHDLETVLDRSRDNRGEDDGHLDGAEGAYVPLCCLQGREAEGWSAFTFWSRYLPGPHHGQSLCGWEVAAAMCALALLMTLVFAHTCGHTWMHTHAHVDTHTWTHTHGHTRTTWTHVHTHMDPTPTPAALASEAPHGSLLCAQLDRGTQACLFGSGSDLAQLGMGWPDMG